MLMNIQSEDFSFYIFQLKKFYLVNIILVNIILM